VDEGVTWVVDYCKIRPHQVIHDPLSDRLLCFTKKNCYALVGDSLKWEKLPNDWYVKMNSLINGAGMHLIYRTFNIFENGVILCRATFNPSNPQELAEAQARVWKTNPGLYERYRQEKSNQGRVA
jgi:hypothetical protein